MIGTGIANTVWASSATASYEMNIGNTLFGTGIDSTTGVGKIGINTRTPATTLDIKGSFAVNVTLLYSSYWASASTYTVQPNDYQLLIDNVTASANTVYLPQASLAKGRVIVITTADQAVTGASASNTLTIKPSGTDKFSFLNVFRTINVATTTTITLGRGKGSFVNLVSDGSGTWYVTE